MAFKTIAFLLIIAEIASASFLEAYLSDAGESLLNGFWRRIEDNHGAPQFSLTKEGRNFELFYYRPKSEQGWWNIQEKIVNGSNVKYGEILYAAPGNDNAPPFIPQSQTWQSAKDYQKWAGASPAPRVSFIGMCLSDYDCDHGDDDCIDYYVNIDDWEDFITPQTPEELMCHDVKWMRNLTDSEVDQMKEDFFGKGIISIPDILIEQVLKQYMHQLQRPFHSTFWQASYWDAKGGYAQMIPRSRENAETIRQIVAEQHARRSKELYAYSFTRTTDRLHPKYRSFYRLFYKGISEFLQSSQLQNLLTEVTGKKYELAVYFLSRYMSGDFLDRHSDSVQTRKLAFTMHFTRDWRLEYGGLLMFMNQDNWDIAEKVCVPRFNTLTIFDVSKERRILPHMVTEIVAGLDKKRIAATGWMQYKGDEEPFSYQQTEGWRVE